MRQAKWSLASDAGSLAVSIMTDLWHWRAPATVRGRAYRSRTATPLHGSSPVGLVPRVENVNRRGLRPTIGAQCGPSVPAHTLFIDNLKCLYGWVHVGRRCGSIFEVDLH